MPPQTAGDHGARWASSPGGRAAVAWCVAILLLVLAASEFARPRQEAGAPGSGALGLVVPLPTRGPPERLGYRTESGDAVVSDPATGSLALYAVRRRPGGTVVRPVEGSAGLPVQRPLQAVGPRNVQVHGRTVYAIRRSGERHVLVVRARGRPDRLIGLPSPRVDVEGTDPDLRVVRWSGAEADLVLMYRGIAENRLVITVLSGESGFVDSVLTQTVTVARGFPIQAFDVVVGRVTDSLPDLIFVTRGRTQTGKTEIHVLSGRSGFQQFLMQVPTTLPSAAVREYAYMLDDGRPSLAAIDVTRSQMQRFDLALSPLRRAP